MPTPEEKIQAARAAKRGETAPAPAPAELTPEEKIRAARAKKRGETAPAPAPVEEVQAAPAPVPAPAPAPRRPRAPTPGFRLVGEDGAPVQDLLEWDRENRAQAAMPTFSDIAQRQAAEEAANKVELPPVEFPRVKSQEESRRATLDRLTGGTLGEQDPAQVYADKLAEAARVGEEAQRRLESGESWDAFRAGAFGTKTSGLGQHGALGGMAGGLLNYINNRFDTDEERVAQTKEALLTARELSVARGVAGMPAIQWMDPKATYRLVADSFGSEKSTNQATGKAMLNLVRYQLQRTVKEGDTSEVRNQKAKEAMKWASQVMTGLKYFGDLPVNMDMLGQEPEKFDATWEDLFDFTGGGTSRALEQITSAVSPQLQRTPSGEMVRGEGPVDWIFRLDDAALSTRLGTVDALMEGRFPELGELLEATAKGETAIPRVLDNPYITEQLASDDPATRAKGAATVLSALGIDVVMSGSLETLAAVAGVPVKARVGLELVRDVAKAAKAERAASPTRRILDVAQEVVRKAAPELRRLESGGTGVVRRLVEPVAEVSWPAWAKAEEGVAAERRALQEAQDAARVEKDVEALGEGDDAFDTAQGVKSKGLDDVYLNNVTRRIADKSDPAKMFMLRPNLRDYPIRKLQGTRRVAMEVDVIQGELDEVTSLLDPIRAEYDAKKAAFATWSEGVKARVGTEAFTASDFAAEAKNYEDQLADLRRQMIPLAKRQRKAQVELVGAKDYEKFYNEASVFERERLVEQMRSKEPLPSYFQEEAPRSFPARSTLAGPVPGGPKASRKAAELGKMSAADLPAKGKMVTPRRDRRVVAEEILRRAGVTLDKGVKDPLSQLRRTLEADPVKVEKYIGDLEAKMIDLRKENPWLVDLTDTDDATIGRTETAINAMLAPDATDFERQEALKVALALGVAKKEKWQEILPGIAAWQRQMRFGQAKDWSFALYGEYYASAGAILKGFKNEVLEPRQADAIWNRYVKRAQEAVGRYFDNAITTDFAKFVGHTPAQEKMSQDEIWAMMTRTDAPGRDKAASVNAWFRSKLIDFGASESGLPKSHILANDLVWVHDGKLAEQVGKDEALWVPGSTEILAGERQKSVYIHPRSFAPKGERIRPGVTALTKENSTWYGKVPVSKKTGFMAKVQKVNADGSVELSVLQFERQGSPRHVDTGKVVTAQGKHLEYMERGRVQVPVENTKGNIVTHARPMTKAELRTNVGSAGVKYSGGQLERFRDLNAPEQFTRENFEWNPEDLGALSWDDFKKMRDRLAKNPREGAVPMPRASFLPEKLDQEGVPTGDERGATGDANHTLRLLGMEAETLLSVSGPEQEMLVLESALRSKDARFKKAAPLLQIELQHLRNESTEQEMYMESYDFLKSLSPVDAREVEKTRRDLKTFLQTSPYYVDYKQTARDSLESELLNRRVESVHILEGEPDSTSAVISIVGHDADGNPIGTVTVPPWFSDTPMRGMRDLARKIAAVKGKTKEVVDLGVSAPGASKQYLSLAERSRTRTRLQGEVDWNALQLDVLDKRVDLAESLGASDDFLKFWPDVVQGLDLPADLRTRLLEEASALDAKVRLEPGQEATLFSYVNPQPVLDKRGILVGVRAPKSGEDVFRFDDPEGKLAALRADRPKRQPPRALRPTGLGLEPDDAATKDIIDQLYGSKAASSGSLYTNEGGRAGVLNVLELAWAEGRIDQEVHDACAFLVRELPPRVSDDVVLGFVHQMDGAGVHIPTPADDGYLMSLLALKNPSTKDAASTVLALAHEYGHAVHMRLPEDAAKAVRDAYQAAKKKGATKRKGFMAFFSKYSTPDVQENEWFSWQFSEYLTNQKLPEIADKAQQSRIVQLFSDLKKEIEAFIEKVFNFGPWQQADPTVKALVDDIFAGRVELERLVVTPEGVQRAPASRPPVADFKAQEAVAEAVRPVAPKVTPEAKIQAARAKKSTPNPVGPVNPPPPLNGPRAKPQRERMNRVERVVGRQEEVLKKIADETEYAAKIRRDQARVEAVWGDLRQEFEEFAPEAADYEKMTDIREDAAFTPPPPEGASWMDRTPVEIEVAAHLRSQFDAEGDPESAYPALTLMQRLAEGSAAKARREGDGAVTADHFLQPLLDVKGDAKNPEQLLGRVIEAFDLPVQDVLVAAKTLDLDFIPVTDRKALKELQDSLPDPASFVNADPDGVAEVQKLLYSGPSAGEGAPENYGAWVPRTGRVPGKPKSADLYRSVATRLRSAEIRATSGSAREYLRRLHRDISDFLDPARDVMDASMRTAVKSVVRDFDAVNNKVNEDLNAVLRQLDELGDSAPEDALVQRIDELYPNTSSGWTEAAMGGTLHTEMLEEVAAAYVDRRKLQLSPEVLKELSRVVTEQMQRGAHLTEVRKALLARTRELVPADQMWGMQEGIPDPRMGDIILVKMATMATQQHEALKQLHGLGAVLGERQKKAVAEWATGTVSSSEGADLAAMGVVDPAEYRQVLGTLDPLAPTEALGAPFASLPAVTRQKKASIFQEAAVVAGKPGVPWAVRQHLMAQILEGKGVVNPELVESRRVAGLTAYKKALTTGLFIVGAGYHLANKVGDAIAIADAAGLMGSIRSEMAVALREVLAIPGVANVRAGFQHILGDKYPRVFENFLTMGSYSDDVKRLQRADGSFKTPDGRVYPMSGLLTIARRMGVNDTFASQEIVKTADQYLRNRFAWNGSVMRFMRKQYDSTVDVAQMISESRRMGLYLELIRQGKEPSVAAQMTTDALIDYRHNLHPLDRSLIIESVFMFWNFTKGNSRRFVRVMMNPDTWGMPSRINRLMEGGTEAATAITDDRDEFGFLEDEMPPEMRAAYQKLKEVWRAKGLHRDSLAGRLWDTDPTRTPINVLGDLKNPNPPSAQFLAEAREIMGEGNFGLMMQEYYLPDPSKWGLPEYLQERATIYFADQDRTENAIWRNGKDVSPSNASWLAYTLPSNPDRDVIMYLARIVSLGAWAQAGLTAEVPGTVALQQSGELIRRWGSDGASRHPRTGPLAYLLLGPDSVGGRRGSEISKKAAESLPPGLIDVDRTTVTLPDGTVQNRERYYLTKEAGLLSGASTAATGMPIQALLQLLTKGGNKGQTDEEADRELARFMFGFTFSYSDPAAVAPQMDARKEDRMKLVGMSAGDTEVPPSEVARVQSSRETAQAFLAGMDPKVRTRLLERALGDIRGLPVQIEPLGSSNRYQRLAGLGRVWLIESGTLPAERVDAMSDRQVLEKIGRP